MTVFSHPSYFPVFLIEDRTERPQSDIIRVIEADSQAMLNTNTENDLQDEFKNMTGGLGTVHTCGRGLLQV
jgi:hypothetical protein